MFSGSSTSPTPSSSLRLYNSSPPVNFPFHSQQFKFNLDFIYPYARHLSIFHPLPVPFLVILSLSLKTELHSSCGNHSQRRRLQCTHSLSLKNPTKPVHRGTNSDGALYTTFTVGTTAITTSSTGLSSGFTANHSSTNTGAIAGGVVGGTSSPFPPSLAKNLPPQV